MTLHPQQLNILSFYLTALGQICADHLQTCGQVSTATFEAI
jgi:hypothetical protein